MSTAWEERVCRSSTADGITKALLAHLAFRADEHGVCWPNEFRIAAHMGISPSTVSRSIRELVERGELVVTRGARGRRGNEYRIALDDVDRARVRFDQLQADNAAKRRAKRHPAYPAERQVQDDPGGPLYPAACGVQDDPDGGPYPAERQVQAADDGPPYPAERQVCTPQAEGSVPSRLRGVTDREQPLEQDEHSNNGHPARADDPDDGGWRDGGEGWPRVRVPGRPALCTTRGHGGCGWQSTADCHDCRGPS